MWYQYCEKIKVKGQFLGSKQVSIKITVAIQWSEGPNAPTINFNLTSVGSL